jgi:hypothetical protein
MLRLFFEFIIMIVITRIEGFGMKLFLYTYTDVFKTPL